MVTPPSDTIDLESAHRLLRTLRTTLQQITKSDPEQEVRGLAIPAVDAALSAVRRLVPDHAVLSKIDDVISPEAVEAGEPIRAVDILLVVEIMLGALPPRPRAHFKVETWPGQPGEIRY